MKTFRRLFGVLVAFSLIGVLAITSLPFWAASADGGDVNGIVRELINDGNRQIFVLNSYELHIADQTKKVQIAMYCKNLSAYPSVCLSASSLRVLDVEGNQYALNPASYFPTVRIASYDVVSVYSSFDVPADIEIATLAVGARDHNVLIDLDPIRSGDGYIPVSNWESELIRGRMTENPEKRMRILDYEFSNNLLVMEIEITNVGMLKSDFNAQYLYLKDSSGIIYKRSSVPSSGQYEPKLNLLTLGKGEMAQGWAAFSIDDASEAVGGSTVEFMLVYDEPNGSFLNTGTFKDNIKPRLALPASMLVKASDSRLGTVVSYNVTASDDHSNPVAVSCKPSSGSIFVLGDTIVSCVAEDAVGNKISDSFTITVAKSVEAVNSTLSIDGNDYVISTIAEDISVRGFTVNNEDKFIVAEVDSRKEGEITMTFPKEVIDGISLVLIDGRDVAFELTRDDAEYSSIKFDLPSSVQHVEIHGARVVPEFGFGAAVLFASLVVVVLFAARMAGTRFYSARRSI